MSGGVRLYGLHRPGASPPHRWPVWAKYALLAGGGLAAFLAPPIWVPPLVLAAAAFCLVGLARVPVREALGLPAAFWAAMAAIIAYHWWFGDPSRGARYMCALLACLWWARLLTATTPAGDLLDALALAARPLRLVGLDPDRAALAAALMWKSIPLVMDSFSHVRDAARARGLRLGLWRTLAPVVVVSIGHALAAGDAIHARGLAVAPEAAEALSPEVKSSTAARNRSRDLGSGP